VNCTPATKKKPLQSCARRAQTGSGLFVVNRVGFGALAALNEAVKLKPANFVYVRYLNRFRGSVQSKKRQKKKILKSIARLAAVAGDRHAALDLLADVAATPFNHGGAAV